MASQGQGWVRAGTKTLTQVFRSLPVVVGEGVPWPPCLHFIREKARA